MTDYKSVSCFVDRHSVFVQRLAHFLNKLSDFLPLRAVSNSFKYGFGKQTLWRVVNEIVCCKCRSNQVDNTFVDPFRGSSRNNGTRRFVRRPVYGQIVGYEEGYVWRNSVTGIEHGNLKTITPNDKGGVNGEYRSFSDRRNGNRR